MAWSSPPEWTLNELVTPAKMNTYVRDNLLALRNPPSCRATQASAQSIPNANYTEVTFGSEAWDSDGIHSTSSNTGRLTPITAGKYLFTASVGFTTNMVALGLLIKKNTNIVAVHTQDWGTASTSGITITALLEASGGAGGSGDYFTCEVYHKQGAATNTSTAYTSFSCLWVAP